MHEEILRRFLVGEAPADELAVDLDGALVRRGKRRTDHPIIDMTVDHTVTTGGLVRVCDAVLGGTLEPQKLKAIGFCIIASDHFDYDTDTDDGSLVAETVHDWSVPEINYPLSHRNVSLWRARLQGKQVKLEP